MLVYLLKHLEKVSIICTLVHLGCCNKILQTGWLINSKHLFLTVLETGKSKIKVSTESVSGENPLLGHKRPSFYCPHMVEGEGFLWGLSYKTSNHIHNDSTLMT